MLVRTRLMKLIEVDSAQLKMNARRHELMHVVEQSLNKQGYVRVTGPRASS